MPSESVLYCFSRKHDAEMLASHIAKHGGKLGYATVCKNADGTYYVINQLNNKKEDGLSFAAMLEYVLRKWW